MSPEALLGVILCSCVGNSCSSHSVRLGYGQSVGFVCLLRKGPIPSRTAFTHFHDVRFTPYTGQVLTRVSGLLCRLKRVSKRAVFVSNAGVRTYTGGCAFM